MRFEFATAGRILFGPGRLTEIGELAAGFGPRALLVTGSNAERVEPVIRSLEAAGVGWVSQAIAHEPTTEDVQRGVALARAEGCTLVIGFGGGSPMDGAKAVAALLANGGDPLDYLEVIGAGRPLTRDSAPCIAVPTTAGTGTEVTRNAVILSPEHGVKVSLRGAGMLPRIALVDPELGCGMSPEVTASTGLDALTQLIEPFVSSRANPMSDAFAREGIRRIARSLRRAYEQGDDRAAREDMSLAAMYSGLAMANAGLGSVHGFAAVIGGMTSGPHGVVCAALLPHAMRVNVRAFRQRAPDSEALSRYAEIGRLLTGSQSAGAEEAIACVEGLCAALHVPSLSTFGVQRSQLPLILDRSAVSSSMKANPIALTRDEMEAIVLGAL
jgi:alcohol dehydrogenase class IV